MRGVFFRRCERFRGKPENPERPRPLCTVWGATAKPLAWFWVCRKTLSFLRAVAARVGMRLGVRRKNPDFSCGCG